MKEATDNTIHPVRPGITVTLGDYGYFKNGLWYRMGNITNIRGLRCSLHVNTHKDIHYECVLSYGVSFKAEAGVSASVSENSLSSKLHLSKNNNFFVRAMVEKLQEYDSVDVEVLEQIKRLDGAGRWKNNYCVVVSVLYSPSYIALFSSCKDRDLQLNTSIEEKVAFENIDVSVALMAGENKNGVELVNHLNGKELSPIGFRTVAWARSLKSWGKKIVSYVGDDDTLNYGYGRDSEAASEPTVYNIE